LVDWLIGQPANQPISQSVHRKVVARLVSQAAAMSTPQRLLTLCLAVVVAVAFGQSAASAKGLPPKQKFEVTYKAEYGQDWYAYGDDNQNWDYAEQCTVGLGASGSSEYHAETAKKVVALPADARKGVIYGQVPVEAWLYRKVTLGQKPPVDCDETYIELANRLDCDSQTPQWGKNGNPPAYLNIIAGKGAVSTDVFRQKEKELIEQIIPWCPFLGTEEGEVGGVNKLPAKKLFDGKAHTIRARRGMTSSARRPTRPRASRSTR
jgi:hypothetical protein